MGAPSEAYDGHPYQPGSDGRLVGNAPAFSLASFAEAVVIRRIAVDEAGNRSRSTVEYDLREIATGEVIRNARPLHRVAGFANGEDVTYHPATKNLKGGPISRGTRAHDGDGDHVLVGFVGGVRDRAVILGALTHDGAPYAAKAADGERRYFQHQGTTCKVADDGSVHVQRSETTITVSKEGDVTISAPAGRLVHLDVPTTTPGGLGAPGVRLGHRGSYQPVLRGSSFRDAFNNLVGYVNSLASAFYEHFHVVISLPTSLPASGLPPNGSLSGASLLPGLGQATQSAASDLSDTVETA